MGDGDDIPYFFRELMAMITTVTEDEWGTCKDPSNKVKADNSIRTYVKRPTLPKKLAQAIESDLLLLEKIANEPIDSFVPIEELPEGYNTAQPKKSNGIYYVHQFFDRANLAVISFLYDKIKDNNLLLCSLLDIFPRASKMHKIAISRLNTNLSKTAGVLSGTLYIPTNSPS